MSKSITHVLRKFFIRTAIWFAIILMGVTIVRATTVALAILQASQGKPYNERLTRNWGSAYPLLHQMLLTIEGPSQRPRTHVQPSTVEKVLLFGPDLLMNVVLQQTRPLWYPEHLSGSQITDAPSPPTDQSRADAPASRTIPQETVPITPSPDVAATKAEHQAPRPPVTDMPDPQPPEPQPTYDPDAMWAAVVNPAAPIYNLEGEQQERIPAGSVMDITEQRRTTNGALFIGTVHSPIGRFDRVAVRAQDLQLYRGKPLHDTTLAEREQASEKARLQGAVISRKEALAAASANRNPHQAEYHQALRRYQALRQEAQGLQTAYETSTGADRISKGNRLRELQQTMATLTPTIRQLRQARDTWQNANPQTAPPDPERDEQIIQLRRQLAALEND